MVVSLLELAHCTVVTKADEPTAVHLPGSRLNAPRTGRPTRSGGLGQLLAFQFLALIGSFFGFMLRLTPTYVSNRLPADAI